MDNLGPGPCPRCHKDAKPLFNTYYCDCDEVTEKIKKSDIEDDEDYSPNPYTLPSNYSTNLSVGLSLSGATVAPIINGVQMKYWFECPLCAKPAFYLDRDEKSIHANGLYAYTRDGIYQMNYSRLNLNSPLCDSCHNQFKVGYPNAHLIHKY
jgi:hypothetical protein